VQNYSENLIKTSYENYCPSPDSNGNPCEKKRQFFLTKKSDHRSSFFVIEKWWLLSKIAMDSWKWLQKSRFHLINQAQDENLF
jgi:hypothetical protein